MKSIIVLSIFFSEVKTGGVITELVKVSTPVYFVQKTEFIYLNALHHVHTSPIVLLLYFSNVLSKY